MATLREEIHSILNRAADEIIAAITAQLSGARLGPARAARGSAHGTRGSRSRMTDEKRAEMVKAFMKIVRSAGEGGASRQQIMKELGWNEGTFNRVKDAAKGDIRMKGNRRTATYHAKG